MRYWVLRGCIERAFQEFKAEVSVSGWIHRAASEDSHHIEGDYSPLLIDSVLAVRPRRRFALGDQNCRSLLPREHKCQACSCQRDLTSRPLLAGQLLHHPRK